MRWPTRCDWWHGTEASTDGGRITVKFLGRLNDSRCPANAMCVWQGDASVRLAVRTASGTRDAVLHTSLEPRALVIDGYVITIAGLFPYPGTELEGAPPQKPIVHVAVARR